MAHMLVKDHTVLSATHTFIHKWNEPYTYLYSAAAERHHTLADTHFRPAEGRSLSWPEWLVTNQSAGRWSPIPVLTGPDVE